MIGQQAAVTPTRWWDLHRAVQFFTQTHHRPKQLLLLPSQPCCSSSCICFTSEATQPTNPASLHPAQCRSRHGGGGT